MEDLSLIKQMYADMEAKQADQNPPPEENPFAKAEEVARELGLVESKPNPMEDIARLVSHYKPKAEKMSRDKLRDAIGNDLEQLEYEPAQVEKMVTQILKKVSPRK
jgi:hypothetical protein